MLLLWLLLLLLSGLASAAAASASSSAEPNPRSAAWHSIHLAIDQARELVESGRLEKATAILRPMLEQAAELEGQDLALAGEVVQLLAEALHRSGRDVELSDRRQLYDLMQEQEKALGPYHPAIAQVLLELACLSYTWGTVAETEKLYQRVVRIQSSLPNADDLATARTYVYLGSLLAEGGFPGKARVAFGEALQLVESEFGTVAEVLKLSQLDSSYGLMAEVVADLGASTAQFGDVAAGSRLMKQARQLFERSIGARQPMAVLVRYHLALLMRRGGETERAMAELRWVLDAWREKLGEGHFYIGIARTELASLLANEGRLSEAHDELQIAKQILTKSLGTRSYRTAMTVTRLADVLWRQGDLPAAKQHFEQAREIHAASPFLEHPEAARTQDHLGRLLWQLGELEPAFEMALGAEAIGRQTLRTYLHSTAEREALFLDGQRPGGLDLLATMLASGTGDVAAGWSEVMRSRTLVLEQIAERYRLARDDDDLRAQSKWSALAHARQRLANLHVRYRGEQSAGPRLQEALAEREAAERGLAEVSATFRQETRRQAAGFAEIRQHLSPETALLAYLRYDHLAAAGGPQQPAKPAYLAFVWAPKSMAQPRVVALADAATIDALVESARGQIPRHSEARYRRAAARLRQAVWDPVAPYVGQAARLVVVADGSLHRMPLSALPLEDGRYWIERQQDLRYLLAERELLPSIRRRPSDGPKNDRALALLSLGGPDFDSATALATTRQPGDGAVAHLAESTSDDRPASYQSRDINMPSCEAWNEVQYPPLPRSSFEARQVAAMHRRWTPGNRVLELTGAAASEAAFKAWAPTSQNLHLATHGFSFQGRCAHQTEEPASPLLWTGLALAGANHRGGAPASGEDGILTAEEISSLDLSGVEWAVLSACDTGLGEPIAGEGVLGLSRAFRIAGVRTLIVSLWPVDDDLTSQWMAELYRGRWQDGLDASSALNAASLKILRQRRQDGQGSHPYYWAPFIATGG